MAFVDECTVYLNAGRGGNGSASLHSEPYKPRGGPDGGNGGDGGSIVFEVTKGVHDLSWLADHPHQTAPGRRARAEARGATEPPARTSWCPVPEGTVVMDDRGLIADLVGEGARAVVAAGGRGGRGNVAFAGPRNRVPRTAELGEDGEERAGHGGAAHGRRRRVWSACPTRASPRCWLASPPPSRRSPTIPFTTLTPNLGVAGEDTDRFVVADIPGLVEGRQRGQGAGAPVPAAHRAMPGAGPGGRSGGRRSRHRPRDALVDELEAYDPELAERPSIVVGTKTDLVDDPATATAALGPEAIAVSAMTGDGHRRSARPAGPAWRRRREAAEPERSPFVVLRPGQPRFTIAPGGTAADGACEGRSVERWVLADRPGRRPGCRAAAAAAREGRRRTHSWSRWARGTATRSPSWTGSSSSCPTSTREATISSEGRRG